MHSSVATTFDFDIVYGYNEQLAYKIFEDVKWAEWDETYFE